jgi:hypothetical protein
LITTSSDSHGFANLQITVTSDVSGTAPPGGSVYNYLSLGHGFTNASCRSLHASEGSRPAW